MANLWTWRGIYFGYKEADNLWTYEGRHVGWFLEYEIYSPEGNYLGELRNDKWLITDTSKRKRNNLHLLNFREEQGEHLI